MSLIRLILSHPDGTETFCKNNDKPQQTFFATMQDAMDMMKHLHECFPDNLYFVRKE